MNAAISMSSSFHRQFGIKAAPPGNRQLDRLFGGVLPGPKRNVMGKTLLAAAATAMLAAGSLIPPSAQAMTLPAPAGMDRAVDSIRLTIRSTGGAMSIGIAGDTTAGAASLRYADTTGGRIIGIGDIATCIIGGISLCVVTIGVDTVGDSATSS
jgi:hypothetical protein